MVKFLHPIYKRLKSVGATPEHQAFLEAIDNQLSELEDDVKLMVSEMQIKKASGGWLDAWGDWYGVKRPNRTTSDDEYREFILREVTKPRNTIPGIVEEIERHLPEGSTVRVHEPYVDIFRFNISEMNMTDRIQDERYTRHAVIDIIIDGPLPPYLADIVHEVKAAGIKVYFTRDSSIWDTDEDGNLTHVRMYSLIEPQLGVFTHTKIKVAPMELFYFNEGILNDSNHLIGGRPWVTISTSTAYELYTDAKRQIATSRNTSFENIKDVSMDEEWLDDYFDAVLVARTLEMYAEDTFEVNTETDVSTSPTTNLINLHTPHILGDSAVPVERYFDVPVKTLYDHGERGEAELYAGTPVMDGLMLWYDFSLKDNYSPGRERATDLSGNGHHGTLQNFNFTPESGYSENKLSFDGVDDYIDAPSNMSHYLTKGSCIETTLYIEDGEEQYPRLFSTATGSLGTGGIAIYLDKIDAIDTDYFSLTAVVEREGNKRRGRFSFNKTYHIVHLYNEDFQSILYVNGEHVDTTQFTQGIPISSNAVIGWDKAFSNARYTKENFNSFRIYNRPLTPEEIAHNYAIEKEKFGLE